MDFFGIGPLELLLILIILMVVVGPEKIPDIARRMGRAVRAFRGATTQITREIEKEMKSVQDSVDINPLRDMTKQGQNNEPPSAEKKRES